MTTPKTDPDIVVVGEPGIIKVASSDDLSGSQSCVFELIENPNDTNDSSSGLKATGTWKENVVFTKVGYRIKKDPVWHGKWVVGVEASKSNIPAETCFVRVSVSKPSSSATIPAINEYRIPGMGVTAHQEMKDIMLHEFSKQTAINAGLANSTYYEEPLKKFISSLTWQLRPEEARRFRVASRCPQRPPDASGQFSKSVCKQETLLRQCRFLSVQV
jgi:hypothetical protein